MVIKLFYKSLSILSILFGIILIINSRVRIIGRVINDVVLTTDASIMWGVFFLVTGALLFYLEIKN
ncbi:MAG: hypothetical protein QXH60_01545 [Candidatus Pacearchaeota archaeon]